MWLSARLEDWVGSLIVLRLPENGLAQLRSLLLLLLLWLLLLLLLLLWLLLLLLAKDALCLCRLLLSCC